MRLAVREHFPLDNGGVAAGEVAANNGAEDQHKTVSKPRDIDGAGGEGSHDSAGVHHNT